LRMDPILLINLFYKSDVTWTPTDDILKLGLLA